MNVWLSQHLLHGLDKCLAESSLQMVFRYEEERLPRVKTVYEKGKSAASAEDKEKYLYKPTFKPLWQEKVCCIIRGLVGEPCCGMNAMHALGCCLLRLSCQSLRSIICVATGQHRCACGGLMLQQHPAASEKHSESGNACWQLSLWICCPVLPSTVQ